MIILNDVVLSKEEMELWKEYDRSIQNKLTGFRSAIYLKSKGSLDEDSALYNSCTSEILEIAEWYTKIDLELLKNGPGKVLPLDVMENVKPLMNSLKKYISDGISEEDNEPVNLIIDKISEEAYKFETDRYNAYRKQRGTHIRR